MQETIQKSEQTKTTTGKLKEKRKKGERRETKGRKQEKQQQQQRKERKKGVETQKAILIFIKKN